MMNASLFTVFDPASSLPYHFPLNWLSTFMALMFIPLLYWFIPSRPNMIMLFITKLLDLEFFALLGKPNQGTTSILLPLFLFILYNNFLGLFPYIFTSSSHLAMTLSLALPLWLSFMFFGWFKNTKHMFAHLVPQGTPVALMVFMVCIETVSLLIRPATLAIRLAANMIAGHLLLTLLGSMGPILSLLPSSLLILTQIALLLLECAVAIIQAYVFTLLCTLYANEAK
nr:ATP synthase F0 subunit 6 [Typhoptera quadrituberculata]